LEDLPAENTMLERNVAALEWNDDEGQADARQVWGCLHSPMSVAELLEKAHSCHCHTARILTRLLQTEQVRPAVA